MSDIVAMDIDLHKIYAVSSLGQVIAKAEPSVDAVISRLIDGLDPGDIVLIEVASPVMYIKDPGVIHNVLKWALWNITAATRLSEALRANGNRVYVAPSHVWTKGHNLKLRHEIAGCKQPQKDLRECEAMIYYYQKSPESWVTMPEYLENL